MAPNLKHANLIIPIFIVICLAYFNYASGYVVAYKNIYKHHSKGGAIVIWVFEGLLQISLLTCLGFILIRGPGRTARIPLFDIYDTKDPELLPVPDIFLCDEHGYPYWCSACNSIKPKRSFHIKELNRCVPRFDHKCIWLGTSVGRDNLVWFFQFIVHFDCLFLIALISAAATARSAMDRSSSNTPHYIVIFACSGLWIPMILALIIQQVAFAFTNRTTIDDICMKQARRHNEWKKGSESDVPNCIRKNYQRSESGVRYVNVKTKTSRVVVPFSVADHPYSEGLKRNITRIVFGEGDEAKIWSSIAYLFIPYAPLFFKREKPEVETYDAASEPFSPSFLAQVNENILRGEGVPPLYCQGEEISSEA